MKIRISILFLLAFCATVKAQNYKCEILKFKNKIENGKLRSAAQPYEKKEVYHSLNSITKIDNYDGDYVIELETIVEDGEFGGYITAIKNSVIIVRTEFAITQSKPSFFTMDFEIQGFGCQCNCDLVE